MTTEDKSVFLECPRCQTAGMLKVGQSVHRGKLRWYESVNCETCGLRSEADGTGLPPEGIRLKLIEKVGLWRVVLGTPSSLSVVVKVVRDALGLESGDAMRIAKSLPGVLYEGTEGEAQWLEALLKNAGESPRLERLEAS